MRLSFAILLTGMLLSNLCAQERFTRTFGGQKNEHGTAIIQTRTGEYVLSGFTYSFGNGKSDIWIMKLDASGHEMWRRYMGGEGYDWANDLIETRDGNYVIAGHTKDIQTGNTDAWVFQVNRHGELMWSHTYGGAKADYAKSLVQTSDGGFAVAGFSNSFSRGKSDVWVVRLNAIGEEIWNKNYGGKAIEKGHSIIETEDEGLLVGGYQLFEKGNTMADMLLVRMDRNGKGIWRKVIRHSGNNVVESLVETPDGNYLAAGWGRSESGKSLDGKLLKIGPGGKVLWENSYGGEGKDALYDIFEGPNGDYMLTGQTASFDQSDDIWLMRVDPQGKAFWQKRAKGDKHDYGRSLVATHDGGFAIIGGTESSGNGGSDICMLKTDAAGNFGMGPLKSEGIMVQQDAPPIPKSDTPDIFKPNLYILTVGVSNYQDNSVSLNFAHTDAAAMAKKFQALEGSLYRKVEVKELLNDDATLVNIRTGISWLERQATQKDMILVFISAHGALDHKGNLYILPTDFNAQNLFATALNIRDLTEGMNGTPCKKLIFLDACHSGQSGYDLLEFASIKSYNLNQAIEELVNTEPGVTVMTSSSGKEFSYENPLWGHGAFTKALLEGLNGSADFNKDKVITLMELNLYVMERVKELTNGRQHPYIPINLFGNIPLFLLD